MTGVALAESTVFVTGTTNGRGTLSPVPGRGTVDIRNTTAFITNGAVNQAVSQGVIAAPQPFTGAAPCATATETYPATVMAMVFAKSSGLAAR